MNRRHSYRGSRRAAARSAALAWSPPVAPELWLDPSNAASVTASGGNLVLIKDLSANAITGTGNGTPGYGATTINGLSTIHQATASWVALPLAHTLTDFSLFAVLKVLTGGATGYNAIVSWGGFSPAIYLNVGVLDYYSVTDHSWSDMTASVGDTLLLTLIRSGTSMTAFKNGVASANNPVTVTGGPGGANFELLSEQFASSSSPGKFDVGEVILLPSAASAGNRVTIETHLLGKWGHSP